MKIRCEYNKEAGKDASLQMRILFSPEELKLNIRFKRILISNVGRVCVESKPCQGLYRGRFQDVRYNVISIEDNIKNVSSKEEQVFLLTFYKVPTKEDVERIILSTIKEVKRALTEARKKYSISGHWKEEVLV